MPCATRAIRSEASRGIAGNSTARASSRARRTGAPPPSGTISSCAASRRTSCEVPSRRLAATTARASSSSNESASSSPSRAAEAYTGAQTVAENSKGATRANSRTRWQASRYSPARPRASAKRTSLAR